MKKTMATILATAVLIVSFLSIGVHSDILVNGLFALNNQSNIFVRYSATDWRVFKGAEMIKSPNNATKGYIQTDGDSMPLCMIGDYNPSTSQIIPATAANTKFLDPAGNGFASADKSMVEPGSGYCAVGRVDTVALKAVILQDDGSVKIVDYQGTAPVSGDVHQYLRNSSDKYEFSHDIGLSPGNANSVSAWYFNSYNNPGKIYAGSDYSLNSETAFFVRYSATEWRVFKGENAIRNSGNISRGYIRTSGSSLSVCMVGDYNPSTGQIVAATAENTRFLDAAATGFASGDKVLDGVVETGYCAVGDVNATTQQAVVLFGDGSIRNITYLGTPPVRGEIHDFKKYYDNKFILAQTGLQPGYANSVSAWDFNSYTGPGRIYAGGYYNLTTDSLVFVRYSATSWRVFKGDSVVWNSGNASRGYIKTRDGNLSLCVVGDYNPSTSQIIPATSSATKFLDEQGNGFSSGDKMLDDVTSGFCAVGLVDSSLQKAVILLDNGTVMPVDYQGSAPVSGEVHSFTKTSASIYTFTQAGLAPNYANSVASWDFNSYTSPQRIYMGANYNLDASSVIFVRYGAREWRVSKGADLVKSPGNASKGYVRTSNSMLEVCVVGGYDTIARQIIAATPKNTRFLDPAGKGFDNGDKLLDGIIEDGFCAVGSVNTTAKSALILNADGIIKKIHYTGTDPVAGQVHRFTRDYKDSYELCQATLIPGYANVNAAWDINAYINPQRLYMGVGLGSMYKPSTAPAMPNYTPAPITGYATHADGGVIYNPLSKEANKTGQLDKYANASRQTATVNGNGFNVTYSIPTNVTAYDMVPVQYTYTQTGGSGSVAYPLTLETTAFEEPGRGSGNMFDLAIPGTMDITYEYLGYVTGTVSSASSRNIMKADNKDTPADAYPNYTTTSLTQSGTVKSGDIVWLKYRYTNTGNTILDPEGIGGFTIYPKLQKKVNGVYQEIGGLYNEYVRETTYVYPGESREFWVNFNVMSGSDVGATPENLGLLSGDYNVKFTTFYRTEADYQPYTNIWQGRRMQVANFPFTASDTFQQTTPASVTYEFTNGEGSRNNDSWLHYNEEFMSTYERIANQPAGNTVTGTLWLQVAPWTKNIMLKAIQSTNPRTIAGTAFGVNMDVASLEVVYNDNNINTMVDENGLRVPVIYSQAMSDMRANVQRSPYPQEAIVNDLLDMKASGINLLTTTGMPWLYDITRQVDYNGNKSFNSQGDAIKYAMDVARVLGFKMEGMGSYPFARMSIGPIANWINGGSYPITNVDSTYGEGDNADLDIAKANAVAYLYQRSRWGDLYWSDKYGVSSYTSEDTRGTMRYEWHIRYSLGAMSKTLFRSWVQNKYTTVANMNAAWGTNYTSFSTIDPEMGQTVYNTSFGVWYRYTNQSGGFYEWSKALIDLDEFRTQQRLDNYANCLADVRQVDSDAKIQLRTEANNLIVPGLSPTADNDHYRHIIYSQLREGTIAEKMVTSDSFRSYTDYPTIPLTPSEITDIVGKSVSNGLIPMLMPQFDNMRDVVINDTTGDDYTVNYNLSNTKKGALIHTLTAVFPWWKATYEAGGVPGVMWQDYQCDGFVTETQVKEMQFFKAKMDLALTEKTVMEKRKAIKPLPEIENGKYTYAPSFVENLVGLLDPSGRWGSG